MGPGRVVRIEPFRRRRHRRQHTGPVDRRRQHHERWRWGQRHVTHRGGHGSNGCIGSRRQKGPQRGIVVQDRGAVQGAQKLWLLLLLLLLNRRRHFRRKNAHHDHTTREKSGGVEIIMLLAVLRLGLYGMADILRENLVARECRSVSIMGAKREDGRMAKWQQQQHQTGASNGAHNTSTAVAG
ncbi:hypothetical protein BC828DRAFT_104223 [Blastocladiella britannica]|nr:hypothetical protein BC828DRAFT_104223 [Blastocladiella britannica]